MSYANVHAIIFATAASGDLPGRIKMSMLKQAAVRAVIVQNSDKVELQLCRDVINGSQPVNFLSMVVEKLDIDLTLQAAPSAGTTDAQIDSAVQTAWAYFLAVRGPLGGGA